MRVPIVAAAIVCLLVLPGCLEPREAPPGGTAPPPGLDTEGGPWVATGDGIEVVAGTNGTAPLRPPFTLPIVATNRGGGDALTVPSGCGSAFTFTLRNSAGVAVRWERWDPMTACHPYPKPFLPGDQVRGEFTWDGLVYSGHPDAEPVRAEAGRYTLEIILLAEGGAEPAVGRVEVPVLVEAEEEAGEADDRSRSTTQDGFNLTGVIDRGEIAHREVATATFTVTNVGADAIVEGHCGTPWRVRVLSANGSEVQARPPEARCLAYSEEPFPEDASMVTEFRWNGTRFPDAPYGEAMPENVPPGTYWIEATFTAKRGEHGEWTRVTVAVPVTVR